MRNKNKYIMGLVLAACVSCQRIVEDEVFTEQGQEVSFNVASEYIPETRTSFSGDISGTSSTTERIDWTVGDAFRIYSPQAQTSLSLHFADYLVESVVSEGSTSFATVSSSAPLFWGDGTNTFYGFYPAPLSGNGAGMSENVVTGTIPKSYTATENVSGSGIYVADLSKHGYMYAVTKGIFGKSEDVSLEFKPLMTAFEFSIRSSGTLPVSSKLTTVSLKSSASTPSEPLPYGGSVYRSGLAGDFTATLNEDGTFSDLSIADNSNRSNRIDVTIPNGGVALSTTKDIKVTLLGLPCTQTRLSLVLTFADGLVRTLDLKNGSAWVSVPAGQKLYVNNAGVTDNRWEYYLDGLTPISLTYTGGSSRVSSTTSFKSYRLSPGGIREKVGYKFQYSTNNGSTWTDGLPSWFSINSPSSLNGSTTGESLTLNMSSQVNTAIPFYEKDVHTRNLYNATPKTNFDLSTINVATGATVSRTTANCYVVQASGTYRFPVVYGNAIKGGSDNPTAYRAKAGISGSYRADAGVSGGRDAANYVAYYMGRYLDHLNDYITSPYIATQHAGKTLTAKLLWTDVPGLVTDVSISGTGSSTYISFSVPKDKIQQGNAVIAVLANNVIAWSWHIWVTDQNLDQTKAGFNGYQFATVDIGYCDALEIERHESRSCLLRVVQTVEGGKTSSSVTISQAYHMKKYGPDNLSFQWGRKDPFQTAKHISLSVNGTSTSGTMVSKTYYATSGYSFQSLNETRAASYGVSIQNPHIAYMGFDEVAMHHSWCERVYINLWNSTCQTRIYSEKITKSVYDPSPVGFVLPPHNAFSGFTETNMVNTQSLDDLVYGREYTVNGLLFPYLMSFSYNSSQNVGSGFTGYCYYWVATASLMDAGESVSNKYVNHGSAPMVTFSDWRISVRGTGSAHRHYYPVRPVKE